LLCSNGYAKVLAECIPFVLQMLELVLEMTIRRLFVLCLI